MNETNKETPTIPPPEKPVKLTKSWIGSNLSQVFIDIWGRWKLVAIKAPSNFSEMVNGHFKSHFKKRLEGL